MKEFNALVKAIKEGYTVILDAYDVKRVVSSAYVVNGGNSLSIYTHCGKNYTASSKYAAVRLNDYSLLLRANNGHKLKVIFFKEDAEAYNSSLALTLLD